MFRTVPLSQGCLASKDTDYATAQKLNLPAVFSTVTTTHVIFCNMQRSATLDYPQWSGSNSNRHSAFYVTSQTSTCTWLYVGSVNIQVLKLNEGKYRGIQHWPLPKQPFSVYSLGTRLRIGNPKEKKKKEGGFVPVCCQLLELLVSDALTLSHLHQGQLNSLKQ